MDWLWVQCDWPLQVFAIYNCLWRKIAETLQTRWSDRLIPPNDVGGELSDPTIQKNIHSFHAGLESNGGFFQQNRGVFVKLSISQVFLIKYT